MKRSLVVAPVVVGCLLSTAATAQQRSLTPASQTFWVDSYGDLFADNTSGAKPVVRWRGVNQTCLTCEDRPGSVHFIIDSPGLTDTWLAAHSYITTGATSGGRVVADLWYDGTHRRLWARSFVAHEVDDPADVRVGRAPGVYPDQLDLTSALKPGTIVGFFGFDAWRPGGGWGAYFAATMGAQLDSATGLWLIGLAPGTSGVTNLGSTFKPEDMLRRVAVYPDGHIDFNYEYDREQLVPPHEMQALNISGQGGRGGNVLYSPAVRTLDGYDTNLIAWCDVDEVITGGGGYCEVGVLRATIPTQRGWQIVCESLGRNRVYAMCARR